jgi:hypothetical protein
MKSSGKSFRDKAWVLGWKDVIIWGSPCIDQLRSYKFTDVYVSSFHIPKGVRKRLDFFRSRFFWQCE